MDICYYNSQIKEQLEGAKDYIKRAIKCKSQKPSRGQTFLKMSTAELGHAKDLMDMFQEDYAECTQDVSDEVSQIYSKVRDMLLDMYTDSVAKIRHMQDMYSDR